jgi:hypothetical protein
MANAFRWLKQFSFLKQEHFETGYGLLFAFVFTDEEFEKSRRVWFPRDGADECQSDIQNASQVEKHLLMILKEYTVMCINHQLHEITLKLQGSVRCANEFS